MTAGFTTRQHCPLCQSSDSELLLEIPYSDHKLSAFIDAFYLGRVPLDLLHGQKYQVVRCRQCDLVYQDRILDEAGMQLLYTDWIDQDKSLQKKIDAGSQLKLKYDRQIRSLAAVLPKTSASPNLLDFGMGWGYWSLAAQDCGFRVSGLELSEPRRQHAISMGINVIDELPQSGEHFDCIVANQVFEHLTDPLATLLALRDCLKHSGIIYLRVPDGRGVVERIESGDWSAGLEAIHPLEHINCFTRKTLISLAARAELKPVNLPLALSARRLFAGLKRAIADRYYTTHIAFKRM